MPRKKIVFAIPTLNEAENIGNVARLVDKGLLWHCPETEAIILNVDNNSPDGTREAFLNTKTTAPKVYISSRAKGKGRNIKKALEYALKEKADALAFIDGDIKSGGPEWVKRLLDPVLKWDYDHVLPLYRRNRFDGSITNHLVYPILDGCFNSPVRQPLAGEVALSRKAIKTFLKEKWPEAAYFYGIDIFLVTESVFHSHRLAQVVLGRKAHKPSAPKLDNMFLQVADSLFRQIVRHKSAVKKSKMRPRKSISSFYNHSKASREPELSLDISYFMEAAKREFKKNKKEIARLGVETSFFRGAPVLSAGDWAHAVSRFVRSSKPPSSSDLRGLRALFYARFIGYWQEAKGKPFSSAERIIRDQAKVFRDAARR